tara:strand:- start:27 stop:851 length:825 start_codon:yes stop_codon:yes gene_type:complete
MHIYYNASEIAALINKNPYKSQEETIHDILCRVKKETNMRDINKFDVISKDELVQLLNLFKNESILEDKQFIELKKNIDKTKTKDDVSKVSKKLFEKVAAESIQIKNTSKSKETQKKLENNIDKIISKKNTSAVKDYVDGFINKQRGIKNEGKIIKKYETIKKTKITNNNDCLYKKHLFTFKDHQFYICGKIDGIENNQLIEVKNRRNRLFTFIPEYEKIQTEIYLRLTNLKSGKLIQNYNDTQSSFDITIDNDLWDLILSELHEVSIKILDLL